jgi:hypothetical protein
MKNSEKEVDGIVDSLTGDLRLGEKYYFFTVTYHYIGRVSKLTDRTVTITDAEIVSAAGDAVDSVSKILNGKIKPAQSETPGKLVTIWLQSLTTTIKF